MIYKIIARPAPMPKTEDSKKIAWVYAGVLLVMVVLQIFNFKEFVDVFIGFWPHHQTAGAVLAGVVAFSEVFAIPFLLRMKLSNGFRVFSMFLSWLVPAIWLFIAISLAGSATVKNVGVLGSEITVTPGLWVVFIITALALLSVWASWGLWPMPHRKTPKRK